MMRSILFLFDFCFFFTHADAEIDRLKRAVDALILANEEKVCFISTLMTIG